MTFTVVSWNMNHWHRTAEQRARAWDYLSAADFDVALLQECVEPATGWSSVGGDVGDNRPWGTRVVSRHALTEITSVTPLGVSKPWTLTASRPGTSALASLTAAGRPWTVVSLYGLMEPRNAYESMNRHLADLGPLLDSSAHYGRVVLGGDLNLTTQWSGANAGYAAIDEALLSQFRAWGLREEIAEATLDELDGCPCSMMPCRHRKTFWQDSVPRQNDYVFGSRQLPLPSVRIDESVIAEELSDHAPVFVEYPV